MKLNLRPFLVAAVLLAGCDQQAPTSITVATTPVPTPHPASGATEAAIKLYPDLAKEGTLFNRTFRELYEERKKSRPGLLARVDWPLTLAQETAAMLNVAPSTPAPTVVATPRPVIPFPVATPTPTALSRGAYDQRHNVARPPIIVDQNGWRVPTR